MNEGPSPNTHPLRAEDARPVLSWSQAGTWSDARDLPTSAEQLHCPESRSPGTFVLKVADSSMAPRFRAGDYIIVDPVVLAESGDFVVVRRPNEGAATFRQLVIEDGRRYLKATNPDCPEAILEAQPDATVCGVVVFRARRM